MASHPSTRSRDKIDTSLTSFSLDRVNSLWDFANVLLTYTALEDLRVQDHEVCEKAGADALTEALAHHTSLTRLQLRKMDSGMVYFHIGIGIHGVTAVAKALQINTTLTHLDFSPMGPMGPIDIAVTPSLSHNRPGDAGANSIADALISNTTLTHLDLGCLDIGPEGSTALAEGLKVNPSLRSLALRGNGLEEAGGAALGDALLHNTGLAELDMRSCGVGIRGTMSMANALKINTSLTILDLRSCCILLQGFIAMAEALQINTTITRLDLGENFNSTITGDVPASEALGEAITLNTSLTWLSLRRFGLGPRGMTAMAKALKINTTLRHLDLSQNPAVGLEDAGALLGAGALAEVLALNSSLTWLGLSNCGFTVEGGKLLGTAWGSNCALSESLKIDMNDGRSRVMHESRAEAIAAVQKLQRRGQLLAFGMGMHLRLGGGGPVSDLGQASAGCPFSRMQPDIFRMVGDAYLANFREVHTLGPLL